MNNLKKVELVIGDYHHNGHGLHDRLTMEYKGILWKAHEQAEQKLGFNFTHLCSDYEQCWESNPKFLEWINSLSAVVIHPPLRLETYSQEPFIEVGNIIADIEYNIETQEIEEVCFGADLFAELYCHYLIEGGLEYAKIVPNKLEKVEIGGYGLFS